VASGTRADSNARTCRANRLRQLPRFVPQVAGFRRALGSIKDIKQAIWTFFRRHQPGAITTLCDDRLYISTTKIDGPTYECHGHKWTVASGTCRGRATNKSVRLSSLYQSIIDRYKKLLLRRYDGGGWPFINKSVRSSSQYQFMIDR
jgi:hypothetical protein